eukprot:Opistho-2@35670
MRAVVTGCNTSQKTKNEAEEKTTTKARRSKRRDRDEKKKHAKCNKKKTMKKPREGWEQKGKTKQGDIPLNGRSVPHNTIYGQWRGLDVAAGSLLEGQVDRLELLIHIFDLDFDRLFLRLRCQCHHLLDPDERLRGDKEGPHIHAEARAKITEDGKGGDKSLVVVDLLLVSLRDILLEVQEHNLDKVDDAVHLGSELHVRLAVPEALQNASVCAAARLAQLVNVLDVLKVVVIVNLKASDLGERVKHDLKIATEFGADCHGNVAKRREDQGLDGAVHLGVLKDFKESAHKVVAVRKNCNTNCPADISNNSNSAAANVKGLAHAEAVHQIRLEQVDVWRKAFLNCVDERRNHAQRIVLHTVSAILKEHNDHLHEMPRQALDVGLLQASEKTLQASAHVALDLLAVESLVI